MTAAKGASHIISFHPNWSDMFVNNNYSIGTRPDWTGVKGVRFLNEYTYNYFVIFRYTVDLCSRRFTV